MDGCPSTINDERISERMSTISRDTIDVITFSPSPFFIDYFSGTRPVCRYIRHDDMSAAENSRIATTREEAVDNDGNDFFIDASYHLIIRSRTINAQHECAPSLAIASSRAHTASRHMRTT